MDKTDEAIELLLGGDGEADVIERLGEVMKMNKETVVSFAGYTATVEQIMEASKCCASSDTGVCKNCPLYKDLHVEHQHECGYLLPSLSLEALKLAVKEATK